ncbi:hypothetical protein [Alkalilimnicola sp. S0819]|uniref:hypothetical protein n=1 Tax=Alkalilimnicola sp. S0819 TaxID=2613922 RepID=UPI0012619D68|nr:hypothetical protein [Alkalilimnicola sp. S0819]KAB7624350.1 hypothetical protein F3N43_05960 [Alkalilimnicola sp. S0819]MPQ16176.1 hypothetical protein [Alkalilimnicola sp. S0819]
MPEPQQIYIPGPLHPDLFGGETPVMLPSDAPKVFRVEVSYLVAERRSRTVTVAAANRTEGARLAVQAVEDRAHEDDHDHEVDDIEALDRAPTTEEMEAWKARRRVAQ